MAADPVVGVYIRGRLALAGLDLSTRLDVWLDAVYAVFVDAPQELLKKLAPQVIRKSATIDPEGFREIWGKAPEHRALAGKLGQGPGVEAGGDHGAAPDQAAVLERWRRTQRGGFGPGSLRDPRRA